VSRTTSIVLVDDHRLVREALRVLLENEPGLSVVGEASDGVEAIEVIARLKPDVVLLDLTMPGMDGLAVLRRMAQEPAPRSHIVVLTMHADEAYVVEALKSGAEAYVLKESSASDLVYAVREVIAGRRYLSPPLSERAIDAYAGRVAASPPAHARLTARELEVLRLSARGMSLPQIATELSISPRTVETHRANFMRKLGLQSQTDLVRYAMREGLLPHDS